MTPNTLHPEAAARARRLSDPASTAEAGSTGAGGDDAPSTPEEAARKFEKVLVRQFTKVMTEDMFSSSLAGEGGGNWMESQRDRQREHMTDMITEQLVESNSLGISEKLMQKWKTGEGPGESDAPSLDALDVPSDVPAAPTESFTPPPTPVSTTPNESHIDHAA